MTMMETGAKPLQLMASEQTEAVEKTPELMRIGYTRVQKESPEYQSSYEGVDQTISVELSTFNFAVQPEPILTLYDFIMTTFVPARSAVTPSQPVGEAQTTHEDVEPVREDQSDAGKIKLRVKLTSIRCKHFVRM